MKKITAPEPEVKGYSMFKATANKGFQMTFANGWTVSVQWGPGNYCANKGADGDAIVNWAKGPKLAQTSADAEIAAWKGGTWYDFGSDTVKGWMTTDEVVRFMVQIAWRE